MTIRAVVVDDEPPAIRRICALVAQEPDVEVVATCGNGMLAVTAIRELRPDLVFLDIQMPEMDGFEVLATLASEPLPQVVFVTAYDQYAVRAFEVRALDYLLKPFTPRRFAEAVERVRGALSRRADLSLNQRMLDLLTETERHRRAIRHFAVTFSGRVVFVPVAEVECIEADRNYMTLYRGREKLPIRDTMANLEKRLDPRVFVRAHRSWMVNVNHIKELRGWFGGGYLVVLRSGHQIPLGRQARQRIAAIIGASDREE
ncbi:MAG: response regulator [Thermoanaerobaculaceae bacterium]|nr:response regulator [Thermoanaerobaculaceae bacterium]